MFLSVTPLNTLAHEDGLFRFSYFITVEVTSASGSADHLNLQ